MAEDIEREIEERKQKLFSFLKQKKDWIVYIFLAVLVFLGTWVRTLNISKLKDVSTGEWTLGPDLDPFLFLRWAEYIVEHGKLFVLDSMRSAPLAEICSGAICNSINTASEMKLLSYMIAYFYKFLSLFSSEITVTYAAIIFPVVMFGLSIIAFFLFSRKIFFKENPMKRDILALVSTAFYSFLPSLLSRTIAGIPEKESASYLFIFLAFYFVLEALESKNFKKGFLFSILAGISTGILGLIWGGVIYVLITISGAILVAFFIKKINSMETIYFSIWVFSFLAVVMPFSTRYSPKNLITSVGTAFTLGVLFILILSEFFKKFKFKKLNMLESKIPREVLIVLISALIGLFMILILFGPSFLFSFVNSVLGNLFSPLASSRFGLTVAENQKPDFVSGWSSSFGPVVMNIPLYFWLFFLGSIFLFYEIIKQIPKKERLYLVFGYVVFLVGLIFSNYSSKTILNGESFLSMLVYVGGGIVFLILLLKVYFRIFRDKDFEKLSSIDFGYLLYFVIFSMTIVGARGATRLIMVLACVTPILVSYLLYKVYELSKKQKDDLGKLLIISFAILVLLAGIWSFYYNFSVVKITAENYAPSSYTNQWQYAMDWVRENTDEKTTVFAHWWDYGYWVQSLGKRATILDGGNFIVYWNHLMGRHVLTGRSEMEALEFLYPHNATHLLIDSTDLGKYTAFSSIGADENYDRFSWVHSFLMDEKQTQESRNKTVYIYPAGTPVDEDIITFQNNKTILIPRKKSHMIGLLLEFENNSPSNLQGVYRYGSMNYYVPLKYLHFSGANQTIVFDNKGIEAGAFLYPSFSGTKINPMGAAIYLSNRTIHSNLVRWYLFGEESQFVSKVHSEDDYVIKAISSQVGDIGSFVYYQGFRGPINIWELKYPENIFYNEDYLKTYFINPELDKANKGEY